MGEKKQSYYYNETFPPSCTNQKCNRKLQQFSVLICIVEACMCSGFLPTSQSLKAFQEKKKLGFFFLHLWLCPPKSKNRQASEGRIMAFSFTFSDRTDLHHAVSGASPGKHRQTFNNVILESLTPLPEHEECLDGLYKL